MAYIWQLENWPNFYIDENKFAKDETTFRDLAGQSVGYLEGIPKSDKEESIITMLVKEAIKTSAIEGEMISKVDLISSIKKNMGIKTPSKIIKDKRSEGIAELLILSREEFTDNLSQAKLYQWHSLLMKGTKNIEIGNWRTHTEPMQIISGAYGKEKVHYEAPPSTAISKEMKQFIAWYNSKKPNNKNQPSNSLVRSAIAHLYYESIHPFEDGNGRIGRILAEKVLSQGLNRPVLLSLSGAIENDKKNYYNYLNKAQVQNRIDDWIKYFCSICIKAQTEFIQSVQYSLKKSRFFIAKTPLLNDRQLKMLQRVLAGSMEGDFIGGINATKYQSINKTSKATATRDLQDLVLKNILIVTHAGRSTSYEVNLEE
ncbi:MAG: DUF4172 domain-containing protein [Chitinophagaceae bacterium]|nr:DUF4172 domain-containing protein [Chitinophagaceae bacterium]